MENQCCGTKGEQFVEVITHGTTEVPVDPDKDMSIQEQVNQVLDENPELLLDGLNIMMNVEVQNECCGEE